MRRLGIETEYGRRPRIKGKIENNFRFVQQDFCFREILTIPKLHGLNAAWGVDAPV